MSNKTTDAKDGNTAPCLACGKPVDMTVEPGMPEHEPLCDVDCIKKWCADTGSEYLTMEEFGERKRRERSNRPYAN